MLTDDLRRLVHETTDHARRWNDGERHTVAAGLLTASGRTVLGLNTYHFLGGPCGEIAALSNHAATCPDDPIVAIAAASGPTGGVIAPCGKCRQVLHDLDPSIRFVVRDASGMITRTASELLPYAYDGRVAEAPQRIVMWEGYERAIRDGRKRRTIRVDDPFWPGVAEIVFEKDTGEVSTLSATVTAVRATNRGELTQDDAIRDGFEDLEQLQAALDRHYPGLAADGPVEVVSFELGPARA